MSRYDWYDKLQKPKWAPPSWLFGTVWSFLYPIIFISFGYVFYKTFTNAISWLIALPFGLNLIANFAFSPIEFSRQHYSLTALDIIVIFLTLIWALGAIYPYSPGIMFVNIPYVLWVGFASVLQIYIAIHNRSV